MLNMKGEGPVVSIDDSRIRKEGGYIILDGTIDFSKLRDGKAFDGINYGPGENFFVWEGWSVSKNYGTKSVTAEKILDKETTINFKAYSEETPTGEEHFLGVEHRIKF